MFVVRQNVDEINQLTKLTAYPEVNIQMIYQLIVTAPLVGPLILKKTNEKFDKNTY